MRWLAVLVEADWRHGQERVGWKAGIANFQNELN